MAIGEIFLGAFLQALFEKLSSRELLNFVWKERRIHKLLTQWGGMLEQINVVVADAEEKQMTDQGGGIKIWLENLEDLAYDLDDILDEFTTEALKRKVIEEARASSTSNLSALLIPTCCMSLNPSPLVSGFRMSSQIDGITTRLQDIFDRRVGLGLQNVVAGPSVSAAPHRPSTTSLIHEPCLFGRDEDKRDWSILKSPFCEGAQGSKVMVTTRDTGVALMVAGHDNYHSLKQLSEDDCWSVFAQLAFEARSIDASPHLVAIGRKIVQKCGGLPLAARTLGGLLRCKLRDDEWEEVLNSKLWELPNEEIDMLPALRLSYHHLPSHLKKCFAYCSILPKDYEFEEKEVVFWWMAEGLIQKPTGQKQMEELGCEYFRELISRSLFQRSSSGEVSLFVMHDLINDLAQFVAGRICFRLEDKLNENEGGENITKARHSSYKRCRREGIEKFEAYQKAKNLRTFLPVGFRDDFFDLSWSNSWLSRDVLLHLLPKLRRLRVLSLRSYVIHEVPSSIGDMKHIRYLDLSYTSIATIPESIGTLYNLQTLLLIECKNLTKLPGNTSDLINLCCLVVTGANLLQEMPGKMGKMTSLQTLSNFIIGKGDGSKISELGSLIHLRGTLCIPGLENVADALDARRANLKDKQGLDVLFLKWNISSDHSRDGNVELEILDMLEPHDNLKELTISVYHGRRIPTWVGNSSFSNMVSFKFLNCEKCISLPPLGQLPSLAKVYIQGMNEVE
ncbi:hypothetical protein RHGRI_019425 [Rhododendron griersonianum]|uniref:Disease resistance RPP13-like protein 1 n=1 Tax=Rhododendron griersonianum TaxID=479676 RepID=A0AAV6JCG0_9ERIC|nr:hypothetical protein RHGRI_019425 [Rhododendron griersonianum]